MFIYLSDVYPEYVHLLINIIYDVSHTCFSENMTPFADFMLILFVLQNINPIELVAIP